MKFVIITNNNMVKIEYSLQYDVRYLDTDFEGVLKEARNMIHNGQKLLSHPLSGSVKPNENPFKSIMLDKKIEAIDFESVQLIEKSLEICGKFQAKFPNLSKNMQEDFEMIDHSLITSAINSVF